MQNTTYFDNIGGEGPAYWLGFFAADSASYANGKQVKVQLARTDRDQVQAIADVFGTWVRDRATKPDKRTGKVYEYSYTLLSSKHLWESLRALGLPQRTGDLTGDILDSIPPHLLRHFVRGYFDGDGHVSIVKGSPRVILCGTRSFLERLEDTLRPLLGFREAAVWDKGTFARLQWSGITQIRRLGDWLYEDSTLFLTRKRDAFNQVPTHRGTSRYRGVYWSKQRCKWIARLHFGGKKHHLGCFIDEEQAARAYDAKAREVYEWPVLNFPA